jgi:mannonate dehydratase
MEQTWRWFGPNDPVTLAHVKQAGATGIVSALHQHYRGEVWPAADIAERRAMIENAGLRWSVVESIPVPNAIKLGGPAAAEAIGAFTETMRRLAQAGVQTICYNFMPVVDWTRTELRHPMPSGGLALRFDMVGFVAYDVFVLERPDAAQDYAADLVARAQDYITALSGDQIARLESTIIAGLPGSEDSHDRAGIAAVIARYADTSPDDLRANLTAFHKAIIPVAKEHGLRMCIHPDDPPFPLFGLPRVVSTRTDYQALFDAVPERENGITFCTGSLGARRDNDVPALLRAFADRVHFVHLRNVTTEDDGSFVEDDHLAGDTDMVTILHILVQEEARRRAQGRFDSDIPFRPDHGHLLLDDQDKETQPGYSAIGRLKGLAELRGILTALTHPSFA